LEKELGKKSSLDSGNIQAKNVNLCQGYHITPALLKIRDSSSVMNK